MPTENDWWSGGTGGFSRGYKDAMSRYYQNKYPVQSQPPQQAQLRPGASRPTQPQAQPPQLPQMPFMPQGPYGNAGRFGGMYQNPQISPWGGPNTGGGIMLGGMLPNMMGAFFGGGGLRSGGW